MYTFHRKSSAVLIVDNLSLDGVEQNVVNDTFTFIIKRKDSDPDSAAVISGTLDATLYGASSKAYKVLTVEETDIKPGYYRITVKWVTDTGRTEYPVVDDIKCLDITFD